MLLSVWIYITIRFAIVYKVKISEVLSFANHYMFGTKIIIAEMFEVKVLQHVEDLLCYHNTCFKWKSPSTLLLQFKQSRI